MYSHCLEVSGTLIVFEICRQDEREVALGEETLIVGFAACAMVDKPLLVHDESDDLTRRGAVRTLCSEIDMAISAIASDDLARRGSALRELEFPMLSSLSCEEVLFDGLCLEDPFLWGRRRVGGSSCSISAKDAALDDEWQEAVKGSEDLLRLDVLGPMVETKEDVCSWTTNQKLCMAEPDYGRVYAIGHKGAW